MPQEKSHSHKFPKSERLTGKITIDRLYKNGSTLKKFPIKLIFIELDSGVKETLQSVITVPKRIHKKAVDRNLIKRRMREVYRRSKHDTITKIKEKNRSYAIMFVYLGKNIDEYAVIEQSMMACLKKFNTQLDEENRS